MLYDLAIAALDSAKRDPVLVRTRGLPTGSSHRLSHFEHVEMDLILRDVDDMDAVNIQGTAQGHFFK